MFDLLDLLKAKGHLSKAACFNFLLSIRATDFDNSDGLEETTDKKDMRKD